MLNYRVGEDNFEQGGKNLKCHKRHLKYDMLLKYPHHASPFQIKRGHLFASIVLQNEGSCVFFFN